MLKLLMLAGLTLLLVIMAAATRLTPHGTAETATPQQVYFRLHNDGALIAETVTDHWRAWIAANIAKLPTIDARAERR